MQASFMKKLLLSKPFRSLLLAMMFVGASANISRQWRNVVRFPPRGQIHARMTSSRINSAFVSRSARRTTILSTKFNHHHRLQPFLSAQKPRVLHMSTSAPTEYTHCTMTDELNESQKEATLRPRYSITRVVAGRKCLN